jgi:hypothetical protein
MAVTLNASTSTGYIQTADTSGDLALQSNGTTQFNVTSTGAYGQLKAGTSVTASGTAVDFTGIPSWVKRITVMFDAVSTNGSSIPQVQIGTSGGIQTTGYISFLLSNSVTNSNTAGFALNAAANQSSSTQIYGALVISLLDSATGRWAASWSLGINAGGAVGVVGGGSKTLSGTLDRVRITTVNGTDTFDAGSINILYEG